jgi:asparagine synthase (glutamine-hydrolysing)
LIRLTGNYGSEVLRSVRAFKGVLPKSGLVSQDLDPQVKKALCSFEDFEKLHPLSFALFHQAPSQGFGLSAVEKSKVLIRSPYIDNRFVQLLYQRPDSGVDGKALSCAIIETNKPELMRIPTDLGDLGESGPVATKFRHIYRKLLFKAEYRANDGMPQWLASLYGRIPWLVPVDWFVGRNKFQHFRLWLRGELSGYLRDVLKPALSASTYLDGRRLGEMVESHLAGRGNFVDEIDSALTLMLTEKMLFGKGPLANRGLHP